MRVHNVNVPSEEQATWVGKNVERFRLERGLEKKQLADMSGLTDETIAKVERGDSVRDATIGKIAKALGIEIEHLFDPVIKFPPTPRPGGTIGNGTYENFDEATLEQWERDINQVIRDIRSISDPEARQRETQRLLVAARVALQQWEIEYAQRRARDARKLHDVQPAGGAGGHAGAPELGDRGSGVSGRLVGKGGKGS